MEEIIEERLEEEGDVGVRTMYLYVYWCIGVLVY